MVAAHLCAKVRYLSKYAFHTNVFKDSLKYRVRLWLVKSAFQKHEKVLLGKLLSPRENADQFGKKTCYIPDNAPFYPFNLNELLKLTFLNLFFGAKGTRRKVFGVIVPFKIALIKTFVCRKRSYNDFQCFSGVLFAWIRSVRACFRSSSFRRWIIQVAEKWPNRPE